MSQLETATGPNDIDVKSLERDGEQAIRGLLARQPNWAKGAISSEDSVFLSGLLRSLTPGRIVEIGVASGWSGAVMLDALQEQPGLEIHGIDSSPTFYLDAKRPTGSVIAEVLPGRKSNYRLHTGRLSFQAMQDVGPVDFGFIDAHHMHPWAVIDMIALLPFLKQNDWVAMHDINLCRVPRHRHMNRGPFYLFHSWPGLRLHSSPELPMIGAVRMDCNPKDHLGFLIELLHNPWEISLTPEEKDGFASFCARHFDSAAQADLALALSSKPPAARG